VLKNKIEKKSIKKEKKLKKMRTRLKKKTINHKLGSNNKVKN